MAIGEICSRAVVFVDPGESVSTAAKLMRQHHVGSVVVVRDKAGLRVPVGMLTDRDITVSIVALDSDPAVMLVGDVMSSEVALVREGAGFGETVEIMCLESGSRSAVAGTLSWPDCAG